MNLTPNKFKRLNIACKRLIIYLSQDAELFGFLNNFEHKLNFYKQVKE